MKWIREICGFLAILASDVIVVHLFTRAKRSRLTEVVPKDGCKRCFNEPVSTLPSGDFLFH